MEKATTKTTALSKTTTTSPSSSSTQAVVETLATEKGIGHFLVNVPKTIEQALERPPISDLIRNGANQNVIEATLAAEIMKVSNMLAVGGNLRQGQALQIAIQLIADFPNESLEDFCLCLRRGIKGTYGPIYRFDVMVIYGWMTGTDDGKKHTPGYLDEKYEAMEAKLMQEKDELYKPVKVDPKEAPDPEKHQQWLDKLKAEVAKLDEKKIPPLTEIDVREEGQEKPKPKLHPVTTASQARKHELHLEWMRQNFDTYTGDKLPTWKPEPEWIEGLSENEKAIMFKKAGV